MRLAVSGSHAVGKSTLVAALRGEWPRYDFVEEPYYQMLDEGHVFADPPSRDDLEAQLERSLSLLTSRANADAVFERCPIDFLAYLAATTREPDALHEWIPRTHDALASIDRVIYLPIEKPDRIRDIGDRATLRRRVDALMREMLIDDDWGFGAKTLEVRGAPAERARQVTRLAFSSR